jgi:lipid A 3-O-deacylase
MDNRVRCSSLLTVVFTTVMVAVASSFAVAEETTAPLPKGTQTVGLTTGPFFPIRFTQDQSSKLYGAATALSSSFVLTDPLGSSWYQGQVSLGAELIGFSTTEPVSAYGIGLTPKVGYAFVALNRLRPYLEGGGGPLWTDLGGRVPEQAGQFNFLLWSGAGCSWALTPRWAMQAGYRFMHISNGDTRHPNSGLNFGLPFLGLSYSLF